MSIYLKNTKLNKLITSIFYVFLCISGTVSPITALAAGSTSSQNTPWYEGNEDLVVEKIGKFLSSTSLAPVVSGGGTFELVGFDQYFEPSQNVVFPIGKITQGNKTYNVLFAAKKNPSSNDVQIWLLCLSKENLPSPLLFIDVASLAQLVPNKNITPGLHVLIEKAKKSMFPNLQAESMAQKWVFFNPSKTEELYIILTPDGSGGTHFSIVDPTK